jgi:AraC-like DNA-binding protein
MAQTDELALQSLRRARDRIDRDYQHKLRVSVLATEAGFTTAQFIRAFHRTYGETPGRYRLRRRMERASDLLRSANLTVTEICPLVGFLSLGSFSAQFSRIVGMSPTGYRLEASRRGGPAPIPGCFVLMWQSGLPLSAAREPDQIPD